MNPYVTVKALIKLPHRIYLEDFDVARSEQTFNNGIVVRTMHIGC